ncbi:acyl carrier protein [Parvibaculum sp.]|uniref:acyl carrier protein n=1 Tax=Parvibaculum sp. TaxID=2024848 RepID=UPI0025F0CF6C|nr:acyl carrier protein [Parvibaculum sp.]
MKPTAEEIEAKVRTAIADVLESPIDGPAEADLEADSLDKIEIAMNLESAFGFEEYSIDDEKSEGRKSVADWCEVVSDLLDARRVRA